ncbi:flagellar biosynthesis anti-sigma factor FlgM [Paenibacillus filicis]|uniref:Negative regulator of flagellin synthesis n=1 Tax=Paenibacillus filicis TaxID=669464 RepID=A0ABU9DUE2_9BACL
MMKINGNDRIGSVNPYKKSQDVHQTASRSKLEKKKDQVEISSEGKELLETQVTNKASQEKLESLKKSVSTGTYHVSPQILAEKIFPFLK